MRIVLTGATGFVGSQVLSHLIGDDSVTQVICVVRRPPKVTSDKVHVVKVNDFTQYGVGLIEVIASCNGCIWTLGGKDSERDDPDPYELITHGFTLAMAAQVAPAASDPFSFCYLSGMGANQRQDSVLPWERLTRNTKGRTEKDLLELAAAHSNFSVHCFRPGGILAATANGLVRLITSPISVRVDQLAAALVDVAKGAEASDVVTNSEIKGLARSTSTPSA